MIMWAIQQADERWLAGDCGWTPRPEDALCFDSRDEADRQANRMVPGDTACHVVTAPHLAGSSLS